MRRTSNLKVSNLITKYTFPFYSAGPVEICVKCECLISVVKKILNVNLPSFSLVVCGPCKCLFRCLLNQECSVGHYFHVKSI